MKRSERMTLARETVEVVKRGYYDVAGARINIREAVTKCHKGTTCFAPEALHILRDRVLAKPSDHFDTQIEVVNETTLSGLTRLQGLAAGPIAVLNFASAKNPGGGFLNGSQAQEESLARSSALHSSLLKVFHFYESHRNMPSCLYTDSMILSPDCPVFRDDEGRLLAEPQMASFITSPAPNYGATADNRPSELPLIPQVLMARSELVLALAAAQGYSKLILGAWGCGVFRNDPNVVAQVFASHLFGPWASRFQRVLFSVLDTSPSKETFMAFQRALGKDVVHGQ